MRSFFFILLFSLPLIAFGQDTIDWNKVDTVEIYDFPNVEAEFPGGEVELQKWIGTHMKYPKEALENEEQGRIYVSFVVEWDGCITNIKIERGVSELLDTECIRLLKMMPQWVPAECDGKKVRTRSWLPFTFRICG